jgi:hypothetical protein
MVKPLKPVVTAKIAGDAKVKVLNGQLLYDTFRVAGGGTFAEAVFFQVQQGAAGSGFTVPKTKSETNLTQGGQIGSPNSFAVSGFSFQPSQGYQPVGELFALYNTASFEFIIGNDTVYYVSPLRCVAGYLGPYGATTATNTSFVTNGIPSPKNITSFRLGKELYPIDSIETFNVKISLNGATLTFTNELRLGVNLHGVFFKRIS